MKVPRFSVLGSPQVLEDRSGIIFAGPFGWLRNRGHLFQVTPSTKCKIVAMGLSSSEYNIQVHNVVLDSETFETLYSEPIVKDGRLTELTYNNNSVVIEDPGEYGLVLSHEEEMISDVLISLLVYRG